MVSIDIQTKKEYGALFIFVGIVIIILSVIAKFLVVLLGVICLIMGIIFVFDLDEKLEREVREWKSKKRR